MTDHVFGEGKEPAKVTLQYLYIHHPSYMIKERRQNVPKDQKVRELLTQTTLALCDSLIFKSVPHYNCDKWSSIYFLPPKPIPPIFILLVVQQKLLLFVKGVLYYEWISLVTHLLEQDRSYSGLTVHM